MVKRMYFFKDGFCFEYDPRPAADRVVKGPTPIATRLKGLKGAFAAKIDAALNMGDGFIFLFSGADCWKYDALTDRVVTPDPQTIAARFPTLPAVFKTGIDAAFNSGNGDAYFFKGASYLRYDLKADRVDAPDPGTSAYPRAINDPNGWRGLPPSFQAGIDAAVFAGEGKIYFFKATEYVRLTFASRSVDVVSPAYPLKIDLLWPGLPPSLDAGVEWIQAGTATLSIQRFTCDRVTAVGIGGVGPAAMIGQTVKMTASFATNGHPSVCGCAEYRQFVQGSFIRNGEREPTLLPNPDGGAGVPLQPRPPVATDANFREDGHSRGKVHFYGHRKDLPDPAGVYGAPNASGTAIVPDQRNGCAYSAVDKPHMSGTKGEAVDFSLDFRGVIIDVSAGGEVLAEQRWTVNCAGVL